MIVQQVPQPKQESYEEFMARVRAGNVTQPKRVAINWTTAPKRTVTGGGAYATRRRNGQFRRNHEARYARAGMA